MILLALLAVQLSAILAGPMPTRQLIVSMAAVIVLAGLQHRHLRRAARSPGWLKFGILVTEVLVTFLPLLAVGASWPGMAGFLAASVLLVVPGRTAWSLVGAIMAGLFAAALTVGLGVGTAAYLTIASLAVGLTLLGVSRLGSMVRHADSRQTEVAQLAVVRERMRFARDLHDLLGASLSAITLRAELTKRLMRSDPATASTELGNVVDIARQAAAEVRQMADGYRNISLAREVAAAASLLASAGVAAQVEMNCGILPDKIDRVLAMTLRELITNVLRHSSARNCWIALGQDDGYVTLSVANDGVARSAVAHRERGGLENLAARLDTVGGTLRARVRRAGRFCVHAEIAVGADAARHDRIGRIAS